MEERGTAASARPRFRSLPTAPRQPPRCLSFHKTNFKVNKAPGTGPLQPLYHPSGVFSFLPPPSRPEPLLVDSIYASCPERDLQGRCLSKKRRRAGGAPGERGRGKLPKSLQLVVLYDRDCRTTSIFGLNISSLDQQPVPSPTFSCSCWLISPLKHFPLIAQLA